MAEFEKSRLFDRNFIARGSYGGTGEREQFHPSIELVYVEDGEYYGRIDGEDYVLHKGDLAVVMPYQVHSWVQKDNHHEEIVLLIDDAPFPEFRERLNSLSFESPILRKKDVPSDLAQLIVIAACPRGGVDRREWMTMYKYVCGAILWSIFTSMPANSVKKGDLSQVQKIVRYIYENYSNEDLSMSEIARHFGYNKTYLSSLINRTFGRNFKSVVNLIRLGEAKKLLAYSERTISDIAYHCGFNSIRTFNDVFMTQETISPTNYRLNSRVVQETQGRTQHN